MINLDVIELQKIFGAFVHRVKKTKKNNNAKLPNYELLESLLCGYGFGPQQS